MSDSPLDPASPAEPPAGETPEPPAAAEPPAPAVHGLFRFTLEGRRAPALFVVGWLATILGLGSGLVGLMSSGMAEIALLVAGLALLTVGLLLLGGSSAIERRAAGLAYAGPSPILVILAAFVATILVAIVAGIPLGAFSQNVERPVGDLIVGVLQALTFLVVVRIMVVGTGAITWAQMGFTRDPGRALRLAFEGATWAIPVVVATAVLAGVIVPILGVSPESPLPPTGTALGLVLNLVTGAIVAPVSEEVLFRGVAATAWARMTGPRQAIVRSSIAFALAHVLAVGGSTFSEAAALVAVAALGRLPVAFALGWIYLRTRSIWASIALHATFNAILILIAEAAVGGLFAR